jgi:glycine cleavage system pyridoxal-binding protein P
MDQLILKTIPNDIRLKKRPDAMSEHEYLEHITELSSKPDF